MKIKTAAVFFLILGVASQMPVLAVTSRVGTAQDLGLGIELGQPMGVTAKYWLSSTAAVDAAMGYHFNSNFDMHADYLWHSFSSFDVQSGRMPFYLGVGGRVNLGDDSNFGMRLPLGATYLLPNDPVEIFAEIAPVVRLLKNIGIDIDGAVGIRVYINYLK